jgi:iron only hydrogenase large subunit-like protein
VPNEPTKQKLQKAEISLTDCLACSGCITSAESVLITLQSHEEVMSVLRSNPRPGEDGHKVPVMSIAPQVLASLAATLDHRSPNRSLVGLHRVLARIRAFAKHRLGFAFVFDTSFARHVAHREHVREFEERSAAHARDGKGKGKELPMLASACPGWVCYVEKTHGELLPFMSATKSPQQVMGTIVKRWLGQRVGKRCVLVLYHSPRKIGRKILTWCIQDQTKSTMSLLCPATTRSLRLPGKISTTSSTGHET